MLRFYRRNALLPQDLATAEREVRRVSGNPDATVSGEFCFYIDVDEQLDAHGIEVLTWLLAETFDPDGLAEDSFLSGTSTLEIGPRLNFETAFSSTAVDVCRVNGLAPVKRLERSRRFCFDAPLTPEQKAEIANALHDRMIEQIYEAPLTSFETGLEPAPVRIIPLIEGGIEELKQENKEQGLAMDEQDLVRFYELYVNDLKRDPTDVELFQLAQGNSEHCRHGFFKGRIFIDGEEQKDSLMTIVKEAWRRNPNNSVIAFHDDSSAIRGGEVADIVPVTPGAPAPLAVDSRVYHPTLTAETHNHPTGVAPYPGAATGTGGRIRDNQAVGRGGIVQASGAAYCVGNLHVSDQHVWEADGHTQPDNLASPLEILVEASNAASDYGNCFGEPLIYGFVRTFGVETPDGYRSWFKPIMYSVGAGQIDDRHTEKGTPEKGMLLVQIGGPAYRIGMGGGAASSMMSGENKANLDFNSVQRGNPEMEQRMGRVLRACVELGDENPIVSAHDLGAGGDCNALPEIAYPAGARIDLRAIPVGDKSLSVLEIWGNESQERNAILVRPNDLDRIKNIAAREKAPIAVVGEVTGDGQLVLHDSESDTNQVELPLEPILGDVEPKKVTMETAETQLQPLDLSKIESVDAALERVLRLPSVSSKSYLTRKVDRCVTGRVAQQQCVGPNHLPLSDYAAFGQSMFGNRGVALSLGEQPLKGLIDTGAMARLAVAEALLNMAGARITQIADIRCSGNWMWAAKLPGEGVGLHRAATAMRDAMIELGIAIDGGKDSLSMAVVDPSGDRVKAPGELVIAAYAPMPDVRDAVTPELKKAGNALVFIDLSEGEARLGGSALAQAWQQVGNETPDLASVALLKNTFEAVQELVAEKAIVACHDRSDGGLVTTLAEMSFGGNLGIDVDLNDSNSAIASLFAEELGLVVEAPDGDEVVGLLQQRGVKASVVGRVTEQPQVVVRHNGETVVNRAMVDLRAIWDETSTLIDALQANPTCVDEERDVMRPLLKSPNWRLTFTPAATSGAVLNTDNKPKVAVLRDQGSNGDRELAASFYAAGFEVWDVAMSDLIEGRISLDQFKGVAFPGGFTYGDVLDAGKAWGGTIRFNEVVKREFDKFYARTDTFSLGICNGAQLMAVSGIVPQRGNRDATQPRFVRNKSGRFECRFVTVEITDSPSIFFRGMEGSRLGVWVAHGEGQLHVPGGEALDASLTPLRFVDPDGNATDAYPFNPNGSEGGVTSLSSPDGRHLAIMPHPERTANQLWQWPWLPSEWNNFETSPWLRMFQNAYEWAAKKS